MSSLLNIPIPLLVLGLIMGLAWAGFYLTGLTKKWGALVPYVFMLLFSAMALPLSWNNRVLPTVWLPLQQSRASIYLAFGVALWLVVLLQLQQLKGKAPSFLVWTLVTVNFYAALLRFVHEGPASGGESIVFATATVLPMVLLPSVVMRQIEDFYLLLRAMVFMNAIWIGMTFVQIAADPSLVTTGHDHRFTGLLSNPQHTGALMAFLTTTLLWLVLNDAKRYRLIYLVILGINCIFLLWTGSRTGLGMTVIGATAVLYCKAGRAILLLPVLGLLVFLGFKIVIDVMGLGVGLDRLASTQDTRTGAWAKLIEHGMRSPLLGVGVEDSEKSENSWLYGFASYGVGMLGLLLMMIPIAAIECLMMLRARFALPRQHRPMIDLCLGVIAMYFAGAMLEGYMISRVGTPLCLVPVFCGAGAILRRWAKSGAHHPEHDIEYAYDGDYDDEYGAHIEHG